jgi:hypothetical protein
MVVARFAPPGRVHQHRRRATPPRARPTPTARRSRSVIERVIAHFKTWRIMHTDYRRPLNTIATTISAVVGLYFYLLA